MVGKKKTQDNVRLRERKNGTLEVVIKLSGKTHRYKYVEGTQLDDYYARAKGKANWRTQEEVEKYIKKAEKTGQLNSLLKEGVTSHRTTLQKPHYQTRGFGRIPRTTPTISS